MRKIGILLKNANIKDITKISNWCKEKHINFEYRYSKNINGKYFDVDTENIPLYYFFITGNTSNFNDLNDFMEGRLVLTENGDFFNILDCNQDTCICFENLIKQLDTSRNASLKADRMLLDFIKSIDDVNALVELRHYSSHFTQKQRDMLDDRIKICSGKKEEVHEQFWDDILSLHNDVKALREQTKMNRKEFCNYFSIPYRTVEDWENKKATCSNYLFKLMCEKLKNDKLI